jgi:hypothetical protein
MSKLIDAGMAIIDVTFDREKRDEKDLAAALKELENLLHLEKYYGFHTSHDVFEE